MADRRSPASPPATRSDGRGDGPERSPSPPSWRVEPSPDGRGAPPKPKPPMLPARRRKLFWRVLVGLLALNVVVRGHHGRPREVHARALRAVLPRPGAGGQRARRSRRRTRRSRARLKRTAPFTPVGENKKTVRGRPLRHAGPGVRRDARADRAARLQERRDQRLAARRRALAAGHDPARLRPDDPARRAVHLVHAPVDVRRRRCAGRASAARARGASPPSSRTA